MEKSYVEVAATFVLYACSLVRGHLTTRLIDLTHVISQDTVFWPGNPEYNFTILHRNLTPPGFWFENNYLATAEHGGTHFDAPAHFFKGGWRSQQIPLERLVGPGCIIDVRRKASADPDYRVTVQDLKDWENKFGKIPHGAVVVMNSDWDKKYPNKTLTFGSDDPTDQTTFHFPGFHEEAADWLVRYRNIHVIGVDTPSLDYGQSRTAPVHVIVSGVNIPGLENVANLNKLPQAGSTIFVGAIKLFDGSGGPARVFATVTEEMPTSNKNTSTSILRD